MRLAGIHSIDNRVLLHEGPIGNQYPAQQEMKTVSLDCHNLKNANDFYFFNWPSALCYKIEKDTNVDNILHRFRRTQATLNGPAVDWVELWVPYEFITKIAPLKKEVGSIPVGAFQASYDREYIPGFSPIAAINIDEVEGTSCKVQAFATADAGGRLRLWIRIGSKTHLLNGHPQQGVESPPSMSVSRGHPQSLYHAEKSSDVPVCSPGRQTPNQVLQWWLYFLPPPSTRHDRAFGGSVFSL